MLTHLATFLLQAAPGAADVSTPDIAEVDVNVLQLLMEGGWYIMLPARAHEFDRDVRVL